MYDCHFHLKTSTSNLKEWSTIDITNWNTTFPERVTQIHQPQGLRPYHQSSSNYSQRSIRRNQHLPRQPIAWIGMTAPMVASECPAAMHAYAIDVSTTLELQTGTTKPSCA